MGQKDITEKQLEEFNDVFADIYNVLVFEKNLIDENRLQDGATESRYKDDSGTNRDQRRDVMKTYLDEYRMELAFVGIDNQTTVDRYIPVRILGYDYGKYRRQVDEKKFPLIPVITLVLNLSNIRWSKYKSLAEITNVPPKFEPYFQDYKVKVVDVAFLEDSVIEKFTSDFKLVAKFFKNRRLGVEEWDDKTRIKHVKAFIDFITAFTDDPRYQNIKEDLDLLRAKGGETGMNDPYYDMLMNREERLARLIGCLLEEGDMDTMKQALVDREVRARLYKKYESEIAIKDAQKEESVSA